MTEGQTSVTLSVAEFEQLLRRIVREEGSRLLTERPTILAGLQHEGPEDPEDDAELVQAALEAIQEHEQNPEASMSWEAFEVELNRAEAAGELPD